MLPSLGLAVCAYCFARLLDQALRKDIPMIAWLVTIVAGLVVAFSFFDILMTGVTASLPTRP